MRGVLSGEAGVPRLKQLLAERQTPNAGLRIMVKGGGCSGLAYQMEWAEAARERDKIFERDGVRVFVCVSVCFVRKAADPPTITRDLVAGVQRVLKGQGLGWRGKPQHPPPPPFAPRRGATPPRPPQPTSRRSSMATGGCLPMETPSD